MVEEATSFRISVVFGKAAHAVARIQWKLLEKKQVQVNYLISKGHDSRK